MNTNQTSPPEVLGSPSGSPSSLERLAGFLEMPVDHVREAAEAIRQERKEKLVASLMSKVALIRERNTAILPTGEIVARGTPGAMNYESPLNDEAQVGDGRAARPQTR